MALLSKLYSRVNWKNFPSEDTPINRDNLNRMDGAIDSLDNRLIEQEALKLDKATANSMIKDVSLDSATGIFTVTRLDGSTVLLDTKLEKLAVNFRYDSASQKLIITQDDGTEQLIDLSSLITEQEFRDSDTVVFEVVNGTVRAKVRAGSITADLLEPDYLAKVQQAAGQAQGAADQAIQSAATAAESKVNALQSAEAAARSETNAAASETAAGRSAEAAALNEKNAEESQATAAQSEASALRSAAAAAQSAANTAADERSAAESRESAAQSAQTAEQNAQTAADKAILARSYAVGGTGTRPGEDTDCALYYMQQAKAQTGNIPVKLSELQNDTGFITAAVDNLINYYKASVLYTKSEVDAKLSAIPRFAIVAVDTLPTENISETTIYLLKEAESGINRCSEWVYINGAWEKLGDIEVDLSGYLLKTGDGSALTETFADASTLGNITSGEDHGTIFGKIAKAISELISHKQTAATASTPGHVKVDTSLSTSSTNPVQNKAVKNALDGKLAATGDASNTTVQFSEAASLTELATGEKLSVSFGKLKLTVKNVINLMKLLGSTDITKLGNGTVTGALTTLNSSLSSLSSRINPAMVVDGSIDNLPPGLYWINGYSSNIEGDIPFTGIHYMLMVSGDKTIGNNQMAVTDLCQIKFRHRDGTGVSWSSWVQNSDLSQTTPNRFVLSGGLKICWGNNATVSGVATAPFPVKYTQHAPYVIAIPNNINTNSTTVVCAIQSITMTEAKFRVTFNNGVQIGAAEQSIYWIAIGY